MYSFKRLFSLLICIIFISLISCKSGGDSPTAPTSTGGSINGKVVDINGNGVTGVTIKFQFNAQIYNILTDSNGNFSITFFENGTYTVTPSMNNYEFSPLSTQIQINGNDVIDVNFTASTSTNGSISGKVVDINGNGVTGVTITYQLDNQLNTIMTDSNGNFSITIVENGTYTVTPSLYNYEFSPSSTQIQISGNDITNANFTKSAIDLKFSPLSSEIAEVGQTTVVNVIVEKASKLISARFIISFDASLVEVTDIETRGTGFIFTDAGVSVIEAEKEIDNENGSIVVGVGGLKQNFTGVGGDGILASITFKGKTSGTGNLSFDTTQSDNILLLNHSTNIDGWEKETFKTQDGTITVQ